MKAVIYSEYGSVNNLELQEIEKPTPKTGEVLIKVYAASVNSWDWDLVRGKPFVARLGAGIIKPKHNILGADIAGVVEAVGKNVKSLKVGDEVFGDINSCGWGGFAEYVCSNENMLALKSRNMSFEQAAVLSQAAVLALQGLNYNGGIKQNQKVLINGAGGGAGTIAIQLAKLVGAEVTAVDSAAKFDLMKSLGADKLIDYKKEDYTKSGEKYDFIIDMMCFHSIANIKKSLASKGTFVMVGGHIPIAFRLMLFGPLISLISKKTMGVLMHRPNKKDLEVLSNYFESGGIVPVIDKRYPLEKSAEAIQYLGDGHVKGKVVITINN